LGNIKLPVYAVDMVEDCLLGFFFGKFEKNLYFIF